MRTPSVTVVIPVKQLARAKSRLALPPRQRRDLALAMATHSVRTALACGSVTRVIVVTRDPLVTLRVGRLGAVALDEPRPSSLNVAAMLGRREARRLDPRTDVAIMVSDLPGLTAEDLDHAIAEFRRVDRPLVVVDHEGTGTTMLIHGASDDPPILFGAGSAAAHRAAGFCPAPGALSGLRNDLDTLPARSDLALWHPYVRAKASAFRILT